MNANLVSFLFLPFYRGQTHLSHRKTVDYLNTNMKLSRTAKSLLQNNPQGFLDAYGPYFIAEIVYGVNFSGSLSFYQKTYSDTSSLNAFASIHAYDLFISGSASENYTQAYNNAGTDVVMTMHGQYVSNSNRSKYKTFLTTPTGYQYLSQLFFLLQFQYGDCEVTDICSAGTCTAGDPSVS